MFWSCFHFGRMQKKFHWTLKDRKQEQSKVDVAVWKYKSLFIQTVLEDYFQIDYARFLLVSAMFTFLCRDRLPLWSVQKSLDTSEWLWKERWIVLASPVKLNARFILITMSCSFPGILILTTSYVCLPTPLLNLSPAGSLLCVCAVILFF